MWCDINDKNKKKIDLLNEKLILVPGETYEKNMACVVHMQSHMLFTVLIVVRTN